MSLQLVALGRALGDAHHAVHEEGGNNAGLWIRRYLLNTDPPMPAQGRPDRYNVVGLEQVSNLELAERVATIVGSSLWYRLVDFASARPGHDPHYGLDGAKLAATGWKPPVPFAESLERTVRWSMLHPEWLE